VGFVLALAVAWIDQFPGSPPPPPPLVLCGHAASLTPY